MFKDLILKNRSYRRFHQDAIQKDTLLELVELARLSPSAANRQPLKYYLSAGEKNKEIFDCLSWAGALPDWPGPEEGERPTGYITILLDRDIAPQADNDAGIVAQSILLGAVEKGLGGCMFGAVSRPKLKEVLALPEQLDILLVIALGKPKEEIVLKPIGTDGDFKYWRDENQVHYVPKRSTDEIIINK
jgi:nitroreductase